MHKDLNWLIGVLPLIWLAMVPLGWRKWARERHKGDPLLEELIDDPAFLIGQTLATVSCCAFIAVYVFALLRIDRPRKVLNSVVLLCFASSCIAVLTLPFAANRAKWFSFASSLLNASSIAVVLFASIE